MMQKSLSHLEKASPLFVGLLMLIFVGFLSSPASAQSPNPNVNFEDWRPGNTHYNTNGLVVEGLGMNLNANNCAYSWTSVEQATVADINSGRATITEISPQSYCGSIGAYEYVISATVSYVNQHASAASTLWGGIMLDEEPNWYDFNSYYTLNNWLAGEMFTTPGIEWWYTENANWPGAWTQTQYNDLISPSNGTSIPAEQVYNSNGASYANGIGLYYQMVTCSAGAPWPYDVNCASGSPASYAASTIAGAPYNQQFGTTHNFQWGDYFQGQ